MQALTQVDGLVAPLDRANVDTDAIIPKQFLKSIKRTGFGPNLFDEWRYLDQGEPGQDCSQRPLNTDLYSTSHATKVPRSYWHGRTLDVAPAVSMRLGPCKTMAFE